MVVRAPGGRVLGQEVYPSVMTMMAAGRVSAAVWMPLTMSVPRPPWGVIWRGWVMRWSVLTSSSTVSTRMAWAGRARVKMALISARALAWSASPIDAEVSTTTVIAALMDHPLEKVLASLCGFGPRTGARTLAEIGDPHRFADGSRLAAYAGLAPVDWQSGRSATARKPRGGNHRLKNAMFTAAFVATQHDPDARAYYQRKLAEGKRHNAVVVCVARRRCNIILAMLKTQTPYHSPQPD